MGKQLKIVYLKGGVMEPNNISASPKEVKQISLLAVAILLVGLVVGGYFPLMRHLGVIPERCHHGECSYLKLTGCSNHEEAMEKVGKFLSENPSKTYKKMWVDTEEECTVGVYVYFSNKKVQKEASLGRGK